jgi:hypothetical protein
VSKFTIDDMRRMFPTTEWGTSFDYEPIDKALGENMVEVRDNDYQGATRILLRDGDRYAIHTYSWGSCSGCDFAQACSTHEEMLEYANSAYADLVWSTPGEIIAKLDTGDAERHKDEWMESAEEDEFSAKCRAALAPAMEPKP